MPRLPGKFLWSAHRKNPLYPLLLQKCKKLQEVQLCERHELRCIHNEFIWLNELAKMTLRIKLGSREDVPQRVKQRCVAKLAKRMVRGQTLPRVVDSQQFGDLDIECPKGVFSPQQCTEASTKHLAHLITTDMREYQQYVTTIRIVDLCSGTGCIPLLLLSLLSKALPNMQFEIVGVDVSPTALALAQRNYTRNLSQYPDTNRHSVSFVQGDLYDWRGLPHWEEEDEYDASVYTVVTCNPPYVSSSTFQQQTERFAKTYITDMALGCLSQEETAELEFQFAPDYDEMAMGRRWWDEDNRFPVEYIQYADYPEAGYYHKAASRAVIFGARMILLEVGGTQQAVNVANMPYDGHQYEGRWGNIEIWGEKPHPDGGLNITEDEVKRSRNRLWQMNFPGSSNSLEGSIPLRGAGEARSVFYSDRWLRGRE